VVVGYGTSVIRLDAEVVFVHVAELILGGGEALVGGLAIPDEGLGVVLRGAAAAEIEIAEGELGLGVAGVGLSAERIRVTLQRGGRCGLLRLGVHGGELRQ